MKQIVTLVLVALLVGCSVGGTSVAQARSDVARQAADPARAADAARQIDVFGFELYRALLAQESGGNVVISPASVALAMAMARAGANAETAAQMDAVLKSLGADSMAEAMNALDAALAARSGTFKGEDGKDYELTLRIANALFAQNDTRWRESFLDALAQRYGAGMNLVDYKSDPEAARALINRWVADQTEQRIPQLLGSGTIDSLTRLVLVNAIYLKAPWARPFEPTLTADASFSLADGSVISVPTMHSSGELAYASGNGWQAVELPYVGNQLALDLIVPDDLATFAASLDADAFASITAALAPSEVDLALPRFAAETKAGLADLLRGMGMADAFDPNVADFSGMTSDEQLYISAVIHQANISVDEKGTEAAAATAVLLSATAMPTGVVHLNVDRPFMFALRDTTTGAVLFLGQITNPAS